MKKHLLIYLSLIAGLKASSQSNVPTGTTAPASVTARQLPAVLSNPSSYFLRTLTPVKAITDSTQVNMSALVEDVNVSTSYYDDWDRNLQSVVKQASPLKKDFVVPVFYDEFGRTSNQYLPYVQQGSNAADGRFKSSPFASDSSFYHSLFPNEQVIYNQKVFKATPMGDLKAVYAEGNSWADSTRGVQYVQRANAVGDSVRLWSIGIESDNDTPVMNGFYQPGSLLVREVTDEKGVKSIVYMDELGRTILTKTQIAASPSSGHAGWLCAYYVYDEMNHIRMVIPPKAVDLLNGSAGWDLCANAYIIGNLCFSYFYDSRGRATICLSPGKGKTYYAYDRFDRVVMTQDPLVRITGQWAFVLYDEQSRKSKTGLLTTSLSKDSVIAQASRSLSYPTLTGTYIIIAEMYYDDYAWILATSAPVSSSLQTSNINSANFISSYNTSPDYAEQITASTRVRGAMTGMKRIIVGTSNYLYSVMIYDEHGRVIQTKETNYTGGTDVLTSQYSFTGRKLRTHLYHQKLGTNAQTHTMLTKYAYDHVGRLKSITKNLDSLRNQAILHASYNELGQQELKEFGDSMELQHFSYNIRGWLTGINKRFVDTAASQPSYFGEALYYDYGFTNNQYDGAIAGIKWKSGGDGIARAYGLNYDRAGRLTVADFSQQNSDYSSWTNDKVDFKVDGLSYDAGGNILSMRQRGLVVGTPATIDSLSYQYFTGSNQLKSVSDGISDRSPLGDFKDTTVTGDEYSYDSSGNLQKDYNRKLYTASGGSGIVYNYLNKPDSIATAAANTVYYTYDAMGMRLAKKVNDYTSGSLVTSSYLYVSGFVYLNDTLQYVLHEQGRIRYAKKYNSVTRAPYFAFEYDYFVGDHLGNVRAVLTEGRDTSNYSASMETADSAHDKALFSNILDPVNTVYAKPLGFDSDTANHFVSRLNSSSGVNKRVGPSLVLRVMKGDQVQLNTYAYYNSTTQPPGSGPNMLTELITALSSGIITQSSNKLGLVSATDVGTVVSPAMTQFLNAISYDTTKPKAFLNWMLLDDQFHYVSSNSGVIQVPGGSSKQALIAPLQSIAKNGYLYVYLSNESPQDVFFDDINVTHVSGPLVQEQSYYPFGLEMAGISGKAFNKLNSAYKFNGGAELEEETNMYSTFYRQYDQQLGRFTSTDIQSASNRDVSSYQFSLNNPLSYNDPAGDMQKYMDHNGNIWLTPGVLQGTANGYMLYDGTTNSISSDGYTDWSISGWGSSAIGQGGRFAGGEGEGGGEDHSAEWERVFATINKWQNQGFNFNSLRFTANANGDFGARMYFTNSDEDVNATVALSTFVSMSFLKESFEAIEKISGAEIGAKITEVTGLSSEATIAGMSAIQQLANKFGGTSYALQDIGEYKLFKLGDLGTATLKNVTRGITFASLTFSLVKIGQEGLNWDNGTDAVVGGLALIPGYGWMIGGAYFLANGIVKSITGRSIGDYIGEGVDWYFKHTYQFLL
jgi:RHS repeat-associated protein